MCVNDARTTQQANPLWPRTSAHSAEQAVPIARDGRVVAHSGEEVRVQADTICLHGDTPTALTIAQAVGDGLSDAGVAIVSLKQIKDL